MKKRIRRVPKDGALTDDQFDLGQEDDSQQKLANLSKAKAILISVGAVMVLATILFHVLEWVDYRILGSEFLLIFIALLYYFANGWKATKKVFRKHWFVLSALYLFGAMTVPFIMYFYGNAFTMDVDRIIAPPKVYYIWSVNPEHFTKEEQAVLKQLNPGESEGEQTYSLMLAAARAADIQADKLKVFDASEIEKGEDFTLVIFQSFSLPHLYPPPPDEPDKGPHMGKKGKLILVFMSPKTPEEIKEVTKPSGTDLIARAQQNVTQQAQLRFTLEFEEVENLQLPFGQLAKGFARSKGRDLDLSKLDRLLRPALPVPAEGSTILKDGPG